jgi:hypothetical protein
MFKMLNCLLVEYLKVCGALSGQFMNILYQIDRLIRKYLKQILIHQFNPLRLTQSQLKDQ